MSNDPYTPSSFYTGGDDDARLAAEYAKMHELANRMSYVNQAAPYLSSDPEMVAQIAQMPYDAEQLGYVAAPVSAQMGLSQTKDYLDTLEPGRQRAVYELLTPSQQAGLTELGFEPAGTGDGGGLFSPLLSVAGQGIGAALGGANTLITKTPVISQTFDIFMWLENAAKTGYRNIATDEQQWLAALGGVAAGVGIAAAPFTGGLSLGLTAGVATLGGLAAGNAIASLTGEGLSVTNPMDWWETTQRNWNGEAVFTREAQIEARNLVGDRLSVLARDIGWEQDPFEIVTQFASTPEADSEAALFHSVERVLDRMVDPHSPDREQRANKLYELLSVPEFVEAVGILERSKTSFGRDIARLVGLDSGDTGYGLLSGGLDAMFTIIADPTLAVGAWTKWSRARRLGVPIQDGTDALVSVNAIAQRANEVPSIGRAYDEVARLINENNLHLIRQRIPAAAGMIDGLREHKLLLEAQGALTNRAFSREDIFTFLENTEGRLDLLRGYGVKTGFGRLLLPTYGFRVPGTQHVVTAGKAIEGARAAINFADDANSQARLRRLSKKLKQDITDLPDTPRRAITGSFQAAELQMDEWENVRSVINTIDNLPLVNTVMRKTGAVMASFTEMMPGTNAISMVGPQAANDIRKLVGLGRILGMSYDTRNAWYDTIMQQDNMEHRINAALSFLDTMLTSGGARMTDEGAALIDQYVNKIHHRYSLSVTNAGFNMGDKVVQRGIWPHQQTFDLPIPDFKALREIGTKGTVSQVLYGVTDNKWVDLGINKLWKPAVLLRLGFITRAAGEELLALLVRAGPSSILNEFGARAVAEGRIYSDFFDPEKMDITRAVLDTDQLRALERFKYVAHVRPLERMFYNWGNGQNVALEWLARYSDFVRSGLTKGFFDASWVERIPETRRVALLGKQNSIRRTFLTGMDQQTVDNMTVFTAEQASSMLNELSAGNASVAAELDSRAQDAFTLHQGTPTEIDEIGYVVERGKYRTYTREGDGDDMWSRIAHHGMGQLTEDTVLGPVLLDVMSRYAPASLSDDLVYQLLGDVRGLETNHVRRLVDELLTHNDLRTVNWDSTLRHMESSYPELGQRLRLRFDVARDDPAFADEVLDEVLHWVKDADFGKNFTAKIEGDVERARDVLRQLGGMSDNDRAWTGSFLEHWRHNADQVELIRDEQLFRQELASKLRDRHFDPEIQPHVQGLTYMNRNQAGQFVAKPPQEGMTRIWVPEVQADAYGRMISAIRERPGQATDELINELMEQWDEVVASFEGRHLVDARDGVERYIRNLVTQQPRDMMRHAAEVSAAGRHGTVVPVAHMGFDDPDLVLAVSRFLNGRFGTSTADARPLLSKMLDSKGFAGELDLSDQIRNYQAVQIDGARAPIAMQSQTLPTSERTIHGWNLNQEELTPRVATKADWPVVTLPDGSRQFGINPDDALTEAVESQVSDVMWRFGTNTDQERIVIGEAYRTPDGKKPIPPGTRMKATEGAYDINGDRIPIDNQEVFDLQDPIGGGNLHENWTATGPVLRDASALHGNRSYKLPDTREIRGLDPDIQAKRDVRAPGPNNEPIGESSGAWAGTKQKKAHFREFRSHHSQVATLANPPKIAIGPSLVQQRKPTAWERILEFGFERVISPSIDAIVRRPMAAHYFNEAMVEGRRAGRWLLNTDLFGDGDNAGRLLDEMQDLVDELPSAQAALRAQAPALRADLEVIYPAMAEDLAGLSDDEFMQELYKRIPGQGRRVDDIVRTARRKHQILDSDEARAVRRQLENVSSNSRLAQVADELVDANTVEVVRLYGLPNGNWTPRKPTFTDGVVAIDVPPDRVSSTLRELQAQEKIRRRALSATDGDPPPTPLLDIAIDLGDMGPVHRIAPTRADVLDELWKQHTSSFRSAYVGHLDEAQWQEIADLLEAQRVRYRRTASINGSSVHRWRASTERAMALKDAPEWAVDTLGAERPHEALLDTFARYLGDDMKLSYDELLPNKLPPALRDTLTEQRWNVIQAAWENKSKVDGTLAQLAKERAVANSIPYLDSHEIRSQAGEYVRGFFPFMYAEENFLKRWARTIKVEPAALRKMQLGYQGLKHIGVVRTDSQGRDWFVYPAMGMVAETSNNVLSQLGLGEVMPSGVVFASETKNMLPGFDIERTGMPSANPLVAVALSIPAGAFPELRPMQEALVGRVGVAQGGVSQFVPSSIRRFWDIAGDETSNVKYASAMMNAIAILEHNGHGLPEHATPWQRDEYLRRLRNHTRGILAAQAFVGFITPGAPSIQFTGKSGLDAGNLAGLHTEIPADVFRNEYLTLVRELGIEEGTIRYYELNPDHDLESLMAFTVGQSSSTSGAPLPATAEAVAFSDANRGWLEQYPDAGAWLLPQPEPGDDEFDEYAYVQQAISGMRQRRTPEEFLTAIMFREGAHDYFEVRDEYRRAKEEAGDNTEWRKALDDKWKVWSQQHKNLHPVFAEQLETGASRQRRARVLDQVRLAGQDPATPVTRHKDKLIDFVAGFDLYKQKIAEWGGRTVASKEKIDQWKERFEENAEMFVLQNPELKSFWLTILRPEAGLD